MILCRQNGGGRVDLGLAPGQARQGQVASGQSQDHDDEIFHFRTSEHPLACCNRSSQPLPDDDRGCMKRRSCQAMASARFNGQDVKARPLSLAFDLKANRGS
jgi:hypothetical protein